MHHAFKGRRRFAAVLLALTLPTAAARATEPVAFLLPDEDGYGIAECFTGGSSCGQGVADGWCEAHGHLKAVAFGASDITGSVQAQRQATAQAGIMIRCGD